MLSVLQNEVIGSAFCRAVRSRWFVRRHLCACQPAALPLVCSGTDNKSILRYRSPLRHCALQCHRNGVQGCVVDNQNHYIYGASSKFGAPSGIRLTPEEPCSSAVFAVAATGPLLRSKANFRYIDYHNHVLQRRSHRHRRV